MKLQRESLLWECTESLPTFSNELKSLPTFDGTIKGQYTGYISVNSVRNYFYWFVESSNSNQLNLPVVLWLNGGPGCSSMLGALTEHGPFTVYKDNSKGTFKIKENPYSWNQFANILYLESPAGVGFSFSNDGNYTTGDDQTAADNLQVLAGFLQLFPQYLSNDFYVAGESYAGHYVPQLAYLIAQSNLNQQNQGIPPINLKGIFVGNPSFNYTTDANYYLEFMSFHGLVSYQQFQNVSQICGGQFYPYPSTDCENAQNDLNPLFDLINPYNILDHCKGQGPSKDGGCFTQQMLSLSSSSMNDRSQPRSVIGDSQTFIPCLDESAILGYLNRADVQKALSVDTSNIPGGSWQPCSGVVNYTQYSEDIPTVYQMLIKVGLRIMVYSGDVDSCVPYLGTSQNVQDLGFPIKTQWRPWLIQDSENRPQVAGYTIDYSTPSQSTLAFTTIKAAGHMVAQYRPKEAAALFERYIQNTPL
eukprot:gene2508-3106_t